MIRKTDDRRVLYTKMFLRESLLALMETKPVEKITPTELCRHAGINRNTFYAHYRSPEELLESIEEEILIKIREALEDEHSVIGTLRILKNNADFCKVLVSPYCPHDFWKRIFEDSIGHYLEVWKLTDPAFSEATQRRVVKYAINGAVAVIQDWMVSGMSTPEEEIAGLIRVLTDRGIPGITEYRDRRRDRAVNS